MPTPSTPCTKGLQIRTPSICPPRLFTIYLEYLLRELREPDGHGEMNRVQSLAQKMCWWKKQALKQ